MTVIAQNSIFGFGPAADNDTQPTAYYRHAAIDVNLNEVDDVRIFDPEVGGVPVPKGGYSAGPLGVGSFVIQPRLKSTVGWLLVAMLGDITSTANTDGTDPDGSYTHKGVFAKTQALPWLGLRELMKNQEDSNNDMGRVFIGARLLSGVFEFSSDGTARMTGAVRARKWAFEDPASWTWSNTLEDTTTVPIPPKEGQYFKIPGFSSTALPMVAATISFISNPLDMRLDKVYGSPYMENITVTDQAMVIDATLKWNDPALYRTIMTGGATGTTWTAQPFEQDFEHYAVAPAQIGTSGRNYSIKFSAPRVLWRVNGGLRTAGRNAVMMRIQGTVLDNAGGDYASVEWVNDTASYDWP